MAINIHPSAHVDPKAQLGDGVEIGPMCVVGSDVKLHKNVKLISQVNLVGHTTIGADCQLYPFVSMGHPPQDFKHKGDPVRIIIGERNVFREHVTIHPGTDAGKPDTIIGNDGYFMVGCHIGHECTVGDNVVISNKVQIGGCSTIGNYVILGGLTGVHQFSRIGDHAFVGGVAFVTTDVIPYAIAIGNAAHLAGLNVIGLTRRGFDRQTIMDIRAAYHDLFTEEGTFAERLDGIAKVYAEHEHVMNIVNFIKARDKRSICMPHTGQGSL